MGICGFRPTQGRAMGKQKPDMIKGTLDMLILKILSIEPMHGWGISERIQQISRAALQVNQGSLYASLHKLTREGWIRSYWEITENNRGSFHFHGDLSVYPVTALLAVPHDTKSGTIQG